MLDLRFREPERFANETCQALAQCIGESLNMRRLSGFFSNWTVFGDRNERLVGFPKIGGTGTTPILGWNRAPELATCGCITIAKGIANNLPGLSTKREPNPDFIRLFCYEGPEFVKFQDGSLWFTWIRVYQGRSERPEAVDFFLAN